MRLLPSDPDIETIVGRIKAHDINLQPEFQRGEVWSRLKKQRLIDSILRDWHVPPVHLIENPVSGTQEVLDGQQRLAAIRDFVDNQIPVDGEIEPLDSNIQPLDGLYYRDLPDHWKRRFNQFTIRVFRIVDYRPTEPSEIFFRLNQPASLTGAEQRNAFFGPVREQIKDLVKFLQSRDLDNELLAFSNSRMAFDDVLARTALAIERRSVAEKITSGDLAELYRSESALKKETVRLIRVAIETLADAKQSMLPIVKFNKATAFSWLIFLTRGSLSGVNFSNNDSLALFLNFFSEAQSTAFHGPDFSRQIANRIPVSRLFSIYTNRSTARVADVSSVVLRDAVLWLLFEDFSGPDATVGSSLGLGRLHNALGMDLLIEDDILARRLIESGWGALP